MSSQSSTLRINKLRSVNFSLNLLNKCQFRWSAIWTSLNSFMVTWTNKM